MSKVMLYALGGAGSNIGGQLEKFTGKSNKGYADLDICYVDTSKSNFIGKEIDESKVYLLEGTDGSGKKRSENYEAMLEATNEILHKFRPADVNVVISSTSGGSGSVLGPIITSELLKRNELVIPVMVGSTGSRIETENTIKTLKSYEMISKKTQKPVVACYRENSKDNPRSKVDNEIVTLIVLIAVFFSAQNKELDAADLNNFLNYHNVSDFIPKLSYLDFWSKEIVLEKNTSLISVTTLCDSENTADIPIEVEYQAVGYLQEENKDILSIQMPVHAGIVSGYYNLKIAALDSKLATYREARKVIVEKSIVSKDSDSATDEGIVL